MLERSAYLPVVPCRAAARQAGVVLGLLGALVALTGCRRAPEASGWEATVWSTVPVSVPKSSLDARGESLVVSGQLLDSEQWVVGGYDSATGRERWLQSGPLVGPPVFRTVVCGASVVGVFQDGSAVGWALDEGTERWRAAAAGPLSVVCGLPDGVVVGTESDSGLDLRRLGAGDGAVAWHRTVDVGALDTPPLLEAAPAGDVVVVANATGWVALDAATGDELGRRSLADEAPPLAIAVQGPTVYLARADSLTAELVAGDGAGWTTPVNFKTSVPFGDFTPRPTLIARDHRLLGTVLGDQAVAAWDTTTGAETWRVAAPTEVWSDGARALDAGALVASDEFVGFVTRTIAMGRPPDLRVDLVGLATGAALWNETFTTPFDWPARSVAITSDAVVVLHHPKLTAVALPVGAAGAP